MEGRKFSPLLCSTLKTNPVSFPTDGNKPNVTPRQCTHAVYRNQTGTINAFKAASRTIFHRRDISAVVHLRGAVLGFCLSVHSTQRLPSCDGTIKLSAIMQSQNHFRWPLSTRPLLREYRRCTFSPVRWTFFIIFLEMLLKKKKKKRYSRAIDAQSCE